MKKLFKVISSFIYITLMFLQCTSNNQNNIVVNNQSSSPLIEVKKENNFKLSDKNVMEFFLEYEKQIWPGEDDNGDGFYIAVLKKQ